MQEKMYEKSDGTILKMSEVHTENLINSLAKEHREIYNSKNKEEFDRHIQKMADIDEELTKRLGKFIQEKGW